MHSRQQTIKRGSRTAFGKGEPEQFAYSQAEHGHVQLQPCPPPLLLLDPRLQTMLVSPSMFLVQGLGLVVCAVRQRALQAQAGRVAKAEPPYALMPVIP